ncbi:MAG: lipocalin-like domain-containing protein [Candidatus Bathyarchaeia archaeon]
MSALHEWWYFNSHLETKAGKHYGLFVSFFSPNVMLFALVDKSERRIVKRFIEKTHIKTSTSSVNVKAGNNWWRQVLDKPFHYAMHLARDDLSLNLELVSRKPPIFINCNGSVRLSLLGSSKYYSLTHMEVSGKLELSRDQMEVKGIGWIDRQWGSWDFGGIGSWIWFSIQLSGNVEILTGQCLHPITGNPIMRFLNIVDDAGKMRVCDKFLIKCLGTWKSPQTGSIYGTRWMISASPDTLLRVVPVLEEQEIRRGLWEGCCIVEGKFQGQPTNGVGYIEESHFRHDSSVLRLISLGVAPLHYFGQLTLGRVDFGVWKLMRFERLNRLARRKKLSQRKVQMVAYQEA